MPWLRRGLVINRRTLWRSAAVLSSLLALAAAWGWWKYGDLFRAPRQRLSLDAFYPEMPPDDFHHYLELPIDHEDPSLGSFKGFYILNPDFKKGGPVAFFLFDGQQPAVKPWLERRDFEEDMDLFLGGLSYVLIGGRGMDPAYFPEVYDGSGRLDIPRAMRLYGSRQYVEDIELVRRDMAAKGLLPPDGKILLFGRSGSGILAQEYLGKHGRHVRRAALMSTGAPDLSAAKGWPFSRDFSDFNPEAAALFEEAVRGGGVDRRYLAWMLFRLGYDGEAGRARQSELLGQLVKGDLSQYRKNLLKLPLNRAFMAASFGLLTESDLPKVRMFETLRHDLMRYEPRSGRGGNFVFETYGGLLEDFVSAARAGAISAAPLTVDRASYEGEVLVLAGTWDTVFTVDIMREIARSYRHGRLVVVDSGHRMEGRRDFCRELLRAFYSEGLGAKAVEESSSVRRGSDAGPRG